MTEIKIIPIQQGYGFKDFQLGDVIELQRAPNDFYLVSVTHERSLVNLKTGCLFNNIHPTEQALKEALIKNNHPYRIVSKIEIKELI